MRHFTTRVDGFENYAGMLRQLVHDKEAMKVYVEQVPGTESKFKMVPIPGGKFRMGSPANEAGRAADEGPQHDVSIEPFWMEEHEVTWAEYELWGLDLDKRKRKIQRVASTPRDEVVDTVAVPTNPYQEMSFGMGKENVENMDQLIDLLPVLARVRKSPGEKIHLVSNTIIEEVLQDIGILDFGDGLSCKANVAIWRTRGEHRPLIGEFAYQFSFQDRDKLNKDALRRAESFFISLQYSAEEYIALNCTKTATVYRLLGNAPKSHE